MTRELRNSFGDNRIANPPMKRTVDGGYLYRMAKVVHLVAHGHKSAPYYEWLVEWPDGTQSDYRTLNECRTVIDRAYTDNDRGVGKDND